MKFVCGMRTSRFELRQIAWFTNIWLNIRLLRVESREDMNELNNTVQSICSENVGELKNIHDVRSLEVTRKVGECWLIGRLDSYFNHF